MKPTGFHSRATSVIDHHCADIEDASAGRFGPDPMSFHDGWKSFVAWAGEARQAATPLDESALSDPDSRPRQVFGIGLICSQEVDPTGHRR